MAGAERGARLEDANLAVAREGEGYPAVALAAAATALALSEEDIV